MKKNFPSTCFYSSILLLGLASVTAYAGSLTITGVGDYLDGFPPPLNAIYVPKNPTDVYQLDEQFTVNFSESVLASSLPGNIVVTTSTGASVASEIYLMSGGTQAVVGFTKQDGVVYTVTVTAPVNGDIVSTTGDLLSAGGIYTVYTPGAAVAPASMTYNPSSFPLTTDVFGTTVGPTFAQAGSPSNLSFDSLPKLPLGLSFTSTGAITGTPTSAQSLQNYTVIAYNYWGTTSTQVSISVTNPAVYLSPAMTVLNTGNTQTFVASGGVPPLTYSVQSGGAGGTVNSSGLYTAPLVTGTDTVVATDSIGTKATSTVTIHVVPTIAMGSNFTCATKSGTGSLYCFGDNSMGNLGLASLSSDSTQVSTPAVASISYPSSVSNYKQISVSSRGNFACAVTNDGNGYVYCWGSNNGGGQLGNNSTTPTSDNRGVPTQVVGLGGSGVLGGITQVATGNYHACAVNTSGAVFCWGENTLGQLGNNTTTGSNVPVQVVSTNGSGTLSSIAGISAGNAYTCAYSTTGLAYCWGDNTSGELGDGTYGSTTYMVHPVQLSLSNVTGISAADHLHTCAVASGSAYCWGDNAYGEIGNGTHGSAIVTTLYQVTGIGTVTSVSAGFEHTCALNSGGQIYCWGSNAFGQLGVGSGTSESDAPAQITALSGVSISGLSVGYINSCAYSVSSNGDLYCWGANNTAQIGDGTTVQRWTPVLVGGNSNPLTSVTSASVGSAGGCAVSGGTSYCWGQDNSGVLGDNGAILATGGNQLVPGKVLGPTPSGSGALGNIVKYSGGVYHGCALTASGSVYCSGAGYDGQLGNNEIITSLSFVQAVGLPAAAVDIAASRYSSCAVTSASAGGNVYCWGLNANGQLGNNSSASVFSSPVEVVTSSGPLTSIVAIAGGDVSVCALDNTGHVWCWGDNTYDQLGVTTPSQSKVALEAPNVSGATQLIGGASHFCILNASQNVYCWGQDTYGQLGNNTTGSAFATPVEVQGGQAGGTNLSGVTSIAGGNQYTCAVTTGGAVFCWGRNGSYQLGNNSQVTALTPVQVVGVNGTGTLSGMSIVSAGLDTGPNGSNHTCAMDTSGNAYCWGGNAYGELGIGSTVSPQKTPVKVLNIP